MSDINKVFGDMERAAKRRAKRGKKVSVSVDIKNDEVRSGFPSHSLFDSFFVLLQFSVALVSFVSEPSSGLLLCFFGLAEPGLLLLNPPWAVACANS